jgi:guanylate kinase
MSAPSKGGAPPVPCPTPLRLERPDRGVLFVVSGPSGVGKSTLVKQALARIPDLGFSVSATTRAPREGEAEGIDYHFVSADRFARHVDEGAFLEHATVYDRRYGTLRAPTDLVLAEGRSILLDIDVQGSAQVRRAMPDAVHIYILPPSWEVLHRRLVARGTDPDDVITRRMALAEEQLQAAPSYDYQVVNDDLEAAHAVLQGILLAEISRTSRRQKALARVVRS